jgi:hypothetical protein
MVDCAAMLHSDSKAKGQICLKMNWTRTIRWNFSASAS